MTTVRFKNINTPSDANYNIACKIEFERINLEPFVWSGRIIESPYAYRIISRRWKYITRFRIDLFFQNHCQSHKNKSESIYIREKKNPDERSHSICPINQVSLKHSCKWAFHIFHMTEHFCRFRAKRPTVNFIARKIFFRCFHSSSEFLVQVQPSISKTEFKWKFVWFTFTCI